MSFLKHYQSLIILLFLIGQQASAQELRYRKRSYEWSIQPIAAISLNPTFEDEKLIVLDEHYKVSYTDYPDRTVIERDVRIKIQQPKQNQLVLTLPNGFDPTLDYHWVSEKRKHSQHRPTIWNLSVNHFAARRINPDGTFTELEWIDSIATRKIWANMINRTAYIYSFAMKDLKPGDEIQVNYRYSYPYQKWHMRFFFHSNLPKQNAEFIFQYASKHSIFCDQRGLLPHDTITTKKPYNT